MSNGDYEIDEQTFMGMTVQQQNWMTFKTFNKYREVTDNRIKTLENGRRIDKAISAGAGVLGGAMAVIGKWFFFKQ